MHKQSVKILIQDLAENMMYLHEHSVIDHYRLHIGNYTLIASKWKRNRFTCQAWNNLLSE